MRARMRCSCALIAGLSMALSTSRNRSWAKPSGASSSSGLTRIRARTASATRSGRSSCPLNVRARTSRRTSAPATAATSSMARHAGERRARRWATTSRTPPGRWTGSPEDRPAATRRVSSRTNSGLPPARRTTSATPSGREATGGHSIGKIGGLLVGEPSEGHHLDAARQPDERRRGVDVTEAPDDQHPRARHATRQERQQRQRRLVGPLEIIEHDHQPVRLGHPDEQHADRVEQLEPIDGPVPRRLVGTGRQLCFRQRVGGVAELTQHLCPRPERWGHRIVPALAPRHQRRPVGCVVGQRAQERRLADPRLARDQHDPAPSAEGAVERGVEPSQRLVASDQVCTATHDR